MASSWQPDTYPTTRRTEYVDIYESELEGQVHVPDPYNWLEYDTEETSRWVAEQAAYTEEYLKKYPHRKRLERDLEGNLDYEKVLPFRES